MVWSRRFLRVAALGAVFALGLAGTALAVDGTWTGGADGTGTNWDEDSNWENNQKPDGTGTATFTKNATIETVASSGSTVGTLKFTDDATLTFKVTTDTLTVKALVVDADKQVNINIAEATDGAFHIADTHSIVKVGAKAFLTLDRGTTTKKVTGAGELQLSGSGTLILKAQVSDANNLKITGGGRLVVEVDDALPALANNPAIDDGNIEINAENFGNSASALTLTKGNLTLNKSMKSTLKTVTINEGRLTVGQGAYIAANDGTDGKVNLGAKGNLVLEDALKVKDLKTADGSKIDTNGKTLTVAALDSDTLNAEVTGGGTLHLKKTAGANTATLKKAVEGTVKIETGDANPLTLAAGANVDVSAVEFAGASVTTATLTLSPNANIGTLSFAEVGTSLALNLVGNKIGRLNLNSTRPLTVTSDTSESTINFLAPAAGASLKMSSGGTFPLRILNGTKVNWNVALEPNTNLAVVGKDLLGGEVTATLGASSKLTLPGGHFDGLTLNATENSSISVDVALGDPVLKVKAIGVAANKLLKMNRPKTWWKSLAEGDTVVLLKAQDVTLNANSKIEGDPKTEAGVADIEWKDGEKALVLEAKGGGIKVPVLKAEPTPQRDLCHVSVKVINDVDVDDWHANILDIVGSTPTASDVSEIPNSKTQSKVGYQVKLGDDFKGGFLRVRAQGPNGLWGFVDAELKRESNDDSNGGTGNGGGGNVGADLSKPASWSRTALTGTSGDVTLQAKLKLDGTPTSLKVEYAGMKEAPKAELLDAAGKVVAKSSVPAVSAAHDYTLKLTCKTTQAEIDKGAEIKAVTVTMKDGKPQRIEVGVKLKDMKLAKPGNDGKTPGGDNGGKNPGGDNGGKTPGGDNGGKTPGGDNDGTKKDSSGGGCDAGFGGLVLALGAAFLLKRKA